MAANLDKAVSGTAVTNYPVSGTAVTANPIVGDSVQITLSRRTRKAIVFLNHFDYILLGCGGEAALLGCDHVFEIREVNNLFRSRWIEGEEMER